MMDGNDVPFYVEDERDGVMELYTLCSSEESVINSGSQQLYWWKKVNASVRNCVFIGGGRIITNKWQHLS